MSVYNCMNKIIDMYTMYICVHRLFTDCLLRMWGFKITIITSLFYNGHGKILLKDFWIFKELLVYIYRYIWIIYIYNSHFWKGVLVPLSYLSFQQSRFNFKVLFLLLKISRKESQFLDWNRKWKSTSNIYSTKI